MDIPNLVFLEVQYIVLSFFFFFYLYRFYSILLHSKVILEFMETFCVRSASMCQLQQHAPRYMLTIHTPYVIVMCYILTVLQHVLC